MNTITPERKARIELAIADTPPLYQPLYRRAMEGKASPRAAIKAACYRCMGFEDVRNQIAECSSRTCPLWEYRPYKSAQPLHPASGEEFPASESPKGIAGGLKARTPQKAE